MSENGEIAKRFLFSIQQHKALPYLFIGSGLSRRYLDLPDWETLLRVFAEYIGSDFDYLKATHRKDYPAIAEGIASEFHHVWWNSEYFKPQVNKFKSTIDSPNGALKVAISMFLKERQTLEASAILRDSDELTEEIRALRNVVVDGVITTNYDTLAEQIFEDFDVYVGQDDLLLSDAQFIAEIYKIHGSVSEPNSLVLTKEDYKKFGERNDYLAAKLLTIFAEHPVVFVGYSLTDKYLAEILGSIARAVGENRIDELGKRIYFVEWSRRPERSMEQTTIERGQVQIPITRIKTDSFQWIWEELARLERTFSAAFVKEMKKSVLNLVKEVPSNEREERVVALPIDSKLAKGLKVVFGVGEFPGVDFERPLSISSRVLEANDLVKDILGNGREPMTSENILLYGIPKHIKPAKSQWLPVWKYMKETGRVDELGNANFRGLDDVIEPMATKKFVLEEKDRKWLLRTFGGEFPTVRRLLEKGPPAYRIPSLLMWLVYDGASAEELREAIPSLENLLESTYLRKFAVLLDLLENRGLPVRQNFDICSEK